MTTHLHTVRIVVRIMSTRFGQACLMWFVKSSCSVGGKGILYQSYIGRHDFF